MQAGLLHEQGAGPLATGHVSSSICATCSPYFLVAESLTNVAKYARATKASVSVRRTDGRIVVEIVDDRVGGARIEGGSGLRGLADRMYALDGTLRVFSPQSRGTRLRAEIPCA
jgi:signal transduction histidine kinase